MTGEYIYGNNYYLVITTEQLNTNIQEEIKQLFGYTEDTLTLSDIVFRKYELADGNWAITIQIIPAKYLYAPSYSVDDFISEQYFELAKQFYGVSEFLTESEFNQLSFKDVPDTEI